MGCQWNSVKKIKWNRTKIIKNFPFYKSFKLNELHHTLRCGANIFVCFEKSFFPPETLMTFWNCKYYALDVYYTSFVWGWLTETCWKSTPVTKIFSTTFTTQRQNIILIFLYESGESTFLHFAWHREAFKTQASKQ